MIDFIQFKPIEEFTYWRYNGTCELSWHRRPTGELFYVDEVDYDKGTVHYYFGGWGYKDTIEEFLNDFTFEPEGEKLRQQQIASLIEMNRQVGLEIEQTKQALQQLNPYNPEALKNVDDSSKALVRGVGAIIPIGDPKQAEKLRAGINSAALIVTTKTEEVKERIKLIEALLTEKTQGLDRQIKEFKAVVAEMEKVVWTINLYLGRDEKLHQIKFGHPAPPETPITIRQKVLWMAEECALHAESGGIDYRSIAQFNDWLTEDPAHLDQVFPEQKGIVVCKPTKIGSKSKNEAWRSHENRKNKETYFLMRNGENLYWLTTDLKVGKHLFPKQDEFVEYFESEILNESTGEYERKVLVPGSAEYNSSMNSADKHVRHYMEIVLFIQGIIHRTHVFEPFPIPKESVNVLDRNSSEEYFRYVLDDEKIITDGHIGFKEWLKNVNSELAVGHRIIGSFHNFRHYEDREDRYDYSKPRKWPRGASAPSNDEIYILGEVPDEPGQLKFSFTRDDIIYRDYYSKDGPPKTKGSFRIYKNDNFILAIDRADIENMEYFLNDRANRDNFENMLPVLKAAIKIKKQEAEDELPFRQLLTSWFINTAKLSAEEAEASATRLIFWYKFKNKNHRALLADDKKAFRMITNEFKAESQRERVREKKEELINDVAQVITRYYPAAIYIGHKEGNQYVVLEPEDFENVFWRERLIRYDLKSKGDSPIKQLKERRWVVADGRRLKWKELLKTERYDNWNFSARAKDFLTFEDTRKLREACLNKLPKSGFGNYGHIEKERINLPLFLTERTDKKQAYLYFYESKGKFDKLTCLSNESKHSGPKMDCDAFNWKKQGKKLIVEGTYKSYGRDAIVQTRKSTKNEKFIWDDENNINEYLNRVNEWEAFKAYRKPLAALAEAYSSAYVEYRRAEKKQERYNKFMREYQNESLWAQWDKQNPADHYHPEYRMVDRILAILVEKGVAIGGLSLSQALDKAKEFGYLPRVCTSQAFGGSGKKYKDIDLTAYDLNYVFVTPETVKVKEEDDDDD